MSRADANSQQPETFHGVHDLIGSAAISSLFRLGLGMSRSTKPGGRDPLFSPGHAGDKCPGALP
jgi:hypothetical protein